MATPTADIDIGNVTISELKELSRDELLELAERVNVSEPDDLTDYNLYEEILGGKAQANDNQFGSGVLEILPDGFGFLRKNA